MCASLMIISLISCVRSKRKTQRTVTVGKDETRSRLKGSLGRLFLELNENQYDGPGLGSSRPFVDREGPGTCGAPKAHRVQWTVGSIGGKVDTVGGGCVLLWDGLAKPDPNRLLF